MQVIFEDTWAEGTEVDVDALIQNVFPVGHPTWVKPQELGTFDAWYTNLYEWSSSRGERAGVVVLREKTFVQNQHPYLDVRCPTVCIGWHLKRHGWTHANRRLVHTTAEAGAFDGAEAVRMKSYLQVLTKLRHCLGFASSIPSREPIYFYKCLLADIAVEPGLRSADYVVAWNAAEVRADRFPIAVPPSDDDVPISDGSDNDDVMVPLQQVVSRLQKKRKTGPGRVSARFPGDGGSDLENDDVVVPIEGDPPEGPSGSGGQPSHRPPPPDPPPSGDPPMERDSNPDDDDAQEPIVLAPPPRTRADQRQSVGWTDGPLGFRVRYDPDYTVQSTGVRFSPNWQVQCKRHGGRCIKKKHVGDARLAEFGDIGPLAFCVAWSEIENEPGKTHGASNPPMERVAAVARANADALKEAVARIVG